MLANRRSTCAYAIPVAAITALAAMVSAAEAQPRPLQAAVLEGPGVLTKCRNWIVYRACRTYDEVQVGPRAEVGGEVPVEYGSATKRWRFPVLEIEIDGGTCTMRGEQHGDRDSVDQLVVRCREADPVSGQSLS